ncbi:hypothetical protein FA15DRAFT_550758, partial [Coprinopsis marcescibilis]
NRKKSDTLVADGKHFGRTVCAFPDIHGLLFDGITQMLGLQTPDGTNGLAITEQHPSDDRCLFTKLLEMNKTLKRCLLEATPEEIVSVSAQIGKGIATARSTDAKGVKTNIEKWIHKDGKPLSPPISSDKRFRGFANYWTGKLLCPVDYDWEDPNVRADLASNRVDPFELDEDGMYPWPMFLYEDYKYDESDPWVGFMRGYPCVKCYKHIFTSPSSAD